MSSFWQTYDEAAARFANNVAVEIQRPGGLEQVTYRGLKEWAEAVAGWLLVRLRRLLGRWRFLPGTPRAR